MRLQAALDKANVLSQGDQGSDPWRHRGFEDATNRSLRALAYLSGRCGLDGGWIGVFPVRPKNSRLETINAAKHDLGGFAVLAQLVRDINSSLQRGLLGPKGGFLATF